MKTVTLLFIATAIGEVIALPSILKRQMEIPLGLMQTAQSTRAKSDLPPFKATKLSPLDFPTATREKITWGPFPLQPANGTHKQFGLKLDKQSDMIENALGGLCKDCMVLRAKLDITDKEGNKLGLENQIYVHHIITMALGRMMSMAPLFPSFGQGSCAERSMGGGLGMMGSPKSIGATGGANAGGHSHGMLLKRQGMYSIFVGKGNEGDATRFSALNNTVVKSGYWIGAKDKIGQTAEVVNYKNERQNVYLTMDYEYSSFQGASPKDYLDVGLGAIQVEQCGNIYLAPPKDKPITYKSSEWNVMGNGYIVSIAPHLHDGALNLKLLVNDKVACQADAIYGEDGGTSVAGQKWETITSYSECKDPIKVKPGDKVKITSDYDLQKHKLRPGSKDHSMEAEAMAIAQFQFAKVA